MDSSRDDWAEGPGLLASIREFPVIVPFLLLLGLVAGAGWSWTRPVEYSGTVRLFVADGVEQSSDPGRVVRSNAQVLSSPEVLAGAATLLGPGAPSVEELKKRFSVTPSTDANVITVESRGATGADAVKLANAVVNAYVALLDKQGKDEVTARLAVLNTRATQLTRQLASLDANLLKRPEDSVVQAQIDAKRAELLGVTREREQLTLPPAASRQVIAHREAAVASTEPVSPRRFYNILVGGLIGLALGCLLAWWFAGRWAARNRTVVVRGVAPVAVHSSVPVTAPVNATIPMISMSRGPEPVRVEPLTASAQAVNVTDPPDGLVLRRVAESLWQNLGADVLVLLLERQGTLDRVAAIGLPDSAQAAPGEAEVPEPEMVRKLLDCGPVVIGLPERQALQGLGVPIDDTVDAVAVPLTDNADSPFGLAVVADRTAGGAPRWGERDTEHVTAVVSEATPPLHAWWVLRNLAPAVGPSSQPSEPAH